MSSVLSRSHLEFETMFSEVVKYDPHPLEMLFWSFGVDYDIIQINEAVCQVQFTQTILHEPLKCCRSIAEAEWHSVTLKESHTFQGESCELLNFFGHGDLPES